MDRLIVMGASLGGLAALRTVLQGLAPRFATPIAIVQHRYKDGSGNVQAFLQKGIPLQVKEVEDKDEIALGSVYIAPADYHLLVEANYFVLSTDEPVCFARPSIDVLFESAANTYAERTIGVILTGANQDGAVGAAHIKAQGGILIVQEPSDALCPIMPAAAIAQTAVDWILPLSKIADRLNQLCTVIPS